MQKSKKINLAEKLNRERKKDNSEFNLCTDIVFFDKRNINPKNEADILAFANNLALTNQPY